MEQYHLFFNIFWRLIYDSTELAFLYERMSLKYKNSDEKITFFESSLFTDNLSLGIGIF
jgi:hypothetical protein